MKSRRVILTLEVETDVTMDALRRPGAYEISVLDRTLVAHDVEVFQAQANVIRETKDTTIRKR